MENLVFIHIPKTGGTYINQVLFNSNDLSASHKCIKHMGNLENKIITYLFCEPSTRTSSSFYSAMTRSGGTVIPINNVKFTNNSIL